MIARVDLEECHTHRLETDANMAATPVGPISIVKRLAQTGIRYAGGGKCLHAALTCLVASTAAPEPEPLRIRALAFARYASLVTSNACWVVGQFFTLVANSCGVRTGSRVEPFGWQNPS